MNAVPAHRKAPLSARLLLAALPLALLLAGCDGGVVEPPPTEPAASVAALIDDHASFTRLDAALGRAGLAGLLASGGPHTVFAPTDEAFYLLGTQTAGLLLDGATPALLTEVLRAHVVSGRHTAADLRARAAEGGTLTALDGVTLDLSLDADGTVRVAGVPVEDADLEADNGLVHAVGGIIHHHLDTAERLSLLPYADDFRAALANADLLGLLTGGVTVLVPIDDGFARQPGGTAAIVGAEAGLRERVLRYHLIPGRHSLDALLADGNVTALEGTTLDFHYDARGLPYVNDARVLAGDLETTDGVLHVIEGPLLENLTLGERVRIIPALSRLRSALSSVGLLSLLDGPGPLTLFAPVDGAFTALGPNVYNPLLSNQQGDLLPRFLRHHVAPEIILSDAFVQGAVFPSLNDDPINVRRDSRTGRLLVDEAPPGDHLDLRAANGVLHLMDGVLIPDVDVVDRMFLAGYTRFLDLVDIAGLEGELRTGGPYTVVAPRNLFAFYFEPQNSCWAEDAVLSHVGEGITEYNPLGIGFSDLAGGFIAMSGPVEEATATRFFGDFEKTTPILDLQLAATNGVVYGVESYLSYLPDVRPPCP